jgi:hypothetical protein
VVAAATRGPGVGRPPSGNHKGCPYNRPPEFDFPTPLQGSRMDEATTPSKYMGNADPHFCRADEGLDLISMGAPQAHAHSE